MNNNKKRDIFYGVVAVATLIVAIIGATLAYFSISVSSNENAVSAKAATVSIEYSDGQEVIAQADELIPSTFAYVKKAYERSKDDAQVTLEDGETIEDYSNVCIDDKEQQICSIYRFSISSTNSERNVTAFLNTNHNGFTYLAYAVYDVTNSAWLDIDTNNYISFNYCNNTNKNESDELITSDDCYTINNNIKTYNDIAKKSIFGYTEEEANTKTINDTTQTYDIVIFLKESNAPQNEEQGQEYRGTIVVDVTGDGYVTGHMDD